MLLSICVPNTCINHLLKLSLTMFFYHLYSHFHLFYFSDFLQFHQLWQKYIEYILQFWMVDSDAKQLPLLMDEAQKYLVMEIYPQSRLHEPTNILLTSFSFRL